MSIESALLEKRFILSTLVVLGAFLLRWNNLLSDASTTQVLIWVTGLFVAGAVGSDWMTAIANKTSAAPPPTAVPTKGEAP